LSGSEFVVLGRLADPYGLQGWIRVHPFGDDHLRWAEMPIWWIGPEGGPWREMPLRELRGRGDGLVVRLADVTDRTAADGLKGMLVAAPRTALPQPDEDEYYWADLVGLKVVNADGASLGTVAGLIETGANDVLRVRAEDGSEHLLPFVGAVVESVDVAAGVIQVAWGSDW
jgi:16S rRNA processing protein RimM